MPAILNNLIFYILFLNSAHALDCINGHIRIRTLGNLKVEQARYCYDKKRVELISPNCLDFHCKAFQNKKMYDLNDLHSNYGKPGFKLCRILSGEPALVEFEEANRWYKSDRCLFREDNSFVDTGTLLGKYLLIGKKHTDRPISN
jgi:hypothetical protein